MQSINYPLKSELIGSVKSNVKPLKINAHIHSPYSFSAFENLKQALELAKKEEIRVLGINDFFVTDGYEEFAELCLEAGIFPLFNIEFIGLNKEDQKNGIRVNDPNNPGRTYLSGKGLAFPKKETAQNKTMLGVLIQESADQIAAMIVKLNGLIEQNCENFRITESEIYSIYARNLIRERHLAKILRIKVSEAFVNEADQIQFFTALYGGKAPSFELANIADFENEIRGRLLKSGGAAFVEETEKAFPELELIKKYIINAGGIPTYPILGDDSKGGFTDFEKDKENLAKVLKERGINSIELIPNRNSFKMLQDYSKYLYNNGFVITYGTEHNTPALTPLEVACRDAALSDELLEISYKGACVIAAHQYYISLGEEGYLDKNGICRTDLRIEFEKTGDAVIRRVIG
jgi:hypothetical protein